MSVTAVPIPPLPRFSILKLWIALALLAAAAVGLAYWSTSSLQVTSTGSGLRYRVLEPGEGPKVTDADLVAMRYRLRKEDGTLIQDSDQTGQPFVTTTQGLFPGFSEGMKLMQAGGRYRLWLPPGLHVSGPLPPGAPFGERDTLVFDIEVLQIAAGMAGMQRMMGQPGAEGAPGAEGPPGGAPPMPSPPPSGR